MTTEKQRPSVYVTQETAHNFIEAEKFGEVRFLTAREPSKMSSSLKNADIVQEVIDNMNEYNPGTDYILPVGSPLVIGVAIAAALKRGADLRMLQWDKIEHGYREFTVVCRI